MKSKFKIGDKVVQSMLGVPEHREEGEVQDVLENFNGPTDYFVWFGYYGNWCPECELTLDTKGK
jgi:hypothetical protein